ncbi:MAG: hypothetical protein E6J34_18295 [Chloroflexi bacterium]|nr:MAG: hypothetical protein E6J34_18295 [Chloroflexota bacterium]
MEKTEQEKDPSINMSIDWHIPECLPMKYASNAFVQMGQYEFIISFFQSQLPLLTGSPEEKKNHAIIPSIKN